ncbi:MAG: hypothetical protein EAS48_10375 [Chryseobacterium sp.]|nr:MAG: hypothetical protein EAS48_10375 [Chryseobacterium sp.]
MKNALLTAIVVSAFADSCSTVQSIVQSGFPYTTNVLISAGVPANQEISSTSAANSIATSLGASNNQVKDIRLSSAKISSMQTGTNLGNFRSVKIYLSGSGTGEVLVASRNDISNAVTDNLSLDPATTATLDRIMKSSTVKVRVAYVLKNAATTDMNLRVALMFSSVPVN